MAFSHFSNDNNNSSRNNNYIPSFYRDMAPLSRQQMIDNASPTRSFGSPHNFTFSYPTQGTTAPTPRPSIQTTCSMPFASATGLGTTWQHSNPSSLTSHSNVSSTTSPSPISTGLPLRSEPKPSCSSPMKRPKCKADDKFDGAPSFKVYLCTDQFANLNLNNDWSKQDNDRMSGNYPIVKEVRGRDSAGWGRFEQVENSIDCDSEEDDEKKKSNEKGVLQVDGAIIDSIASAASDAILPKNVLKEIVKPCMQVVLWKCPGELVRDLVQEESKKISFDSPSITQQLLSPATTSSPNNFLLPKTFDKSSTFAPASGTAATDNKLSCLPLNTDKGWQQHLNTVPTTMPFNRMSSTSSSISSSPSSLPLSSSSMKVQTMLPPKCHQTDRTISSSSSLLLSEMNRAQSNVSMVSQDPDIWDDDLDLDFVDKYDEEMQL